MCRILSSSTARYILFNRQIKIESHGIENYLQSLRWWVVFHASFGACRMFNAPYYGNFSWRLWLDLFITVLVSSVYFYSRRTSVACHFFYSFCWNLGESVFSSFCHSYIQQYRFVRLRSVDKNFRNGPHVQIGHSVPFASSEVNHGSHLILFMPYTFSHRLL